MKINLLKNKLVNSVGVLALAAVMLFASTSAVNAQVAYGSYSPQSQTEVIAYLQGIIAQLQAQMVANSGSYQTTPTYYQPYQPYGQVQGAAYGAQRQDVEVGTGFVGTDRSDYILNGTIDLRGASYAYVWFEYGDDDDFGRSTTRQSVTDDGRYDARVRPDRNDDYLYYRAVAESPSGHRDYGYTRAVYSSNSGSSSGGRYGDEPEVDTLYARDIDRRSAELRGEVDMNDYRNGLVFFVYGEDEDDVEDVDREDEYRDIYQRGDDLRKVSVDSDLDGRDTYSRYISGLDYDTEYFFRICVEYEDDDDDERLECGAVEDFETDRY